MPINRMEILLDGISKHVAQARRKIGIFLNKSQIFDCCWYKQMPLTDQNADSAQHVSNYI